MPIPSPERDQLYRDLVARYAKHWAKNPAFSAKGFALTSRSPDAPDVISFVASSERFLFSELIMQSDLSIFDTEWMLELAEVVHRNPLLEQHLPFAAQIYAEHLPRAIENSRLVWAEKFARLLLDLERWEDLQELWGQFPELRTRSRNYLAANLLNPHGRSPLSNSRAWLSVWEDFFRHDGNPAPTLTHSATKAFDRLTAPAGLTAITDGPLVSVIMTAYNPDPVAIETSIRSVLQQTWQNLELLIVDDASAAQYTKDIAKLAELDPRIRVIHLPENGGTYKARNAGWAEAKGEFITGQDADDWTHPMRVQKQVQAMIDDPNLAASTSMSTRVYDNLNFLTNREHVIVRNESSLMVRRHQIAQFGGYMPIRKGADSELRLRINAITGVEDLFIREVLSVVRSTPGSLSTADFASVWAHPARGAFIQSFIWWHRNTAPAGLPRKPGSTIPFPTPSYLATKTPEPRNFDVVLSSTWTSPNAEPDLTFALAPFINSSLKRLGVLQLQSAKSRSTTKVEGHPEMLRLLQAGTVEQVIATDADRAAVFVITNPTLLNFVSHDPLALQATSLYVVATEELLTPQSNPEDIGYYPRLVRNYLQAMTGLDPVWIPATDKVRHAFAKFYPQEDVTPENLGIVAPKGDVSRPRTYFRSNLPVIGRFAGADRSKWPTEFADFAAAYPDSPEVEIRTCGRIARELRGAVVGQKNNNWLTFENREIPIGAFLNSLDFYVYFDQEPGLAEAQEEIRLALASGLVVILPEHYREYFGDAVLYCKPQRVQELVLDLYGDPQRYFAQSARAIQYVLENFSPEAAATRLLNIIGHKSAGKP